MSQDTLDIVFVQCPSVKKPVSPVLQRDMYPVPLLPSSMHPAPRTLTPYRTYRTENLSRLTAEYCTPYYSYGPLFCLPLQLTKDRRIFTQLLHSAQGLVRILCRRRRRC